jgi:hypothetical protein
MRWAPWAGAGHDLAVHREADAARGHRGRGSILDLGGEREGDAHLGAIARLDVEHEVGGRVRDVLGRSRSAQAGARGAEDGRRHDRAQQPTGAGRSAHGASSGDATRTSGDT